MTKLITIKPTTNTLKKETPTMKNLTKKEYKLSTFTIGDLFEGNKLINDLKIYLFDDSFNPDYKRLTLRNEEYEFVIKYKKYMLPNNLTTLEISNLFNEKKLFGDIYKITFYEAHKKGDTYTFNNEEKTYKRNGYFVTL